MLLIIIIFLIFVGLLLTLYAIFDTYKKIDKTREQLALVQSESEARINSSLKFSSDRDMNLLNNFSTLVKVLAMAKYKMDDISLQQYGLSSKLSQVASDFDNVPKVREMLFETQPNEMAMYADHFTIDASGQFIFHRALRHFNLLPKVVPPAKGETDSNTEKVVTPVISSDTPVISSDTPVISSDTPVIDTFIGAINTDNITGKCISDAIYRGAQEELCKFCESPQYASLCDSAVPYYYWINNNPVSSQLFSDFEEQCLELDSSNVKVKSSCELINSVLPASRILRVYHLFKMIVDSMTLIQLGAIFMDNGIDESIDIVRDYSYVLIDKEPAKIYLGRTSYTLGLEEKDMPFAKMLIILALKLKEAQKPLPFLNINGSSNLPGSQR